MPRHHAYRTLLGHSPIGSWALAAAEDESEPVTGRPPLDEPNRADGGRPGGRPGEWADDRPAE